MLRQVLDAEGEELVTLGRDSALGKVGNQQSPLFFQGGSKGGSISTPTAGVWDSWRQVSASLRT
ncbi:hypothetical protein CEE37_03495 [candidate division LCP-89 bacterium B3_LCP]|uniref:Uncharacterized protein n=1 Tax=candidate division LCP-89 bacterium B3_LCP TaxID=2012998 RepID=A0A532V351_UNCL8|nr:MAG: hypothetical protein CEE37_03495 [candidate division LCP-89 bacterium B3_LCP]